MKVSRGRFAGGAPLIAAAILLHPFSTAVGQVTVESNAQELSITGRVHTQFNTTSVSGEPGSEFLIRRARFAAELKMSDVVSGKVEPDFGEGKISLKDAYLRLTFGSVRATFGQTKRPFDLFELTSSTQMLVVERAGGIRGVDSCAGPGGLCSLSQFTEKLQYSDRDIGVFLDGSAEAFGWSVSVTNGPGANRDDENGAKSFSGRVTFSPLAQVRVGANVGVHDYVAPAGSGAEYATAFGGDVEVGNFTRGIHLQAGLVTGDNWQNLVAAEPSTFLTAQAIVSYKSILAGNRYVSAVEPVARVSWGDPDTNADDDEGLLVTPGFMVHFIGRNRIAANVDVWVPSVGDTEWSLKVQSFLHF